MSLLLDARKKSQAALGGNGAETQPPTDATLQNAPPYSDKTRVAGHNLFNAKSFAVPPALAGINRNLLIALGGTVLLLSAGGGYVWYITSAGSNQALRPVARPPAATPVAQQPPAIAPAAITGTPPKIALAPEVVPAKPASAKQPTRTARTATRTTAQQARSNTPMLVEQHQAEPIDPLLNSAYQAYREGKFDQAQQLYREVLKLDERNSDALLGLAAIAQRRGADGVAAHYYAKVLELNPRDAVANAGMSALSTSGNIESRLKILLNEQRDSAPLHFALGNLYAAQERWAEAQQAYFNACKLEPKNAGLAFHLAISLERLGQKKLAALYYQSALELDTSHSEGFDHAIISQRIEELAGMARSQP
jgi:Flp pilus assembly protein TadD